MNDKFIQIILMGLMLSVLAKSWIDIFQEIMNEDEE